MIDPNKELDRIHKRLLDRIWKAGEVIHVREEDYKEIVNVRFTFRFTPVEKTNIQYIKIIDWQVIHDITDLCRLFDKDQNSRQMFLYFPELINGHRPCNLIYHFLFRKDAMNLNVYTRSWDIINKWLTDIHTALYCLEHMAKLTGKKKGRITFFVGSCHVPLRSILKDNNNVI
jgi:thymidylate synthase